MEFFALRARNCTNNRSYRHPKKVTPKNLRLQGSLAVLFFALPIIALLLRPITSGQSIVLGGIGPAVGLSVFTSLLTVVFTALFGTPLAYLLARRRFWGRRALIIIIEMPIVLPPTVAGLALLLLLGRNGLLGSPLDSLGVRLPFSTAAVVIAQVFVAGPFFVRAAQVGFSNIPQVLEAAAKVDGASGWQVWRLVTLPLALPALVAGLSLTWARAMGEFGATILFAGSLAGRTQTLPLFIYNVWERNIDDAIWAGIFLIIVAALALAFAQLLARQAEKITG
jgi:molybdate transport system permease protein